VPLSAMPTEQPQRPVAAAAHMAARSAAAIRIIGTSPSTPEPLA
jgi:hypothetical protein